MPPDLARSVDLLCRQLTENIMSAALCAKEIVGIVREMHDDGARPAVNGNSHQSSGFGPPVRPLVDETTLCVTWNGKIIHLGHTRGFWLLARLTRSANRYVTHVDLLQEVWDDEFTDTAALRAGVRRLRVKLRRGGMRDLADAIVGHHGRYMLSLPPGSIEGVLRHHSGDASNHVL